MLRYKIATYVLPFVVVSMVSGVLAFAEKGQYTQEDQEDEGGYGGQYGVAHAGLPKTPDALIDQVSVAPREVYVTKPVGAIFIHQDQEAIQAFQTMKPDADRHGMTEATGAPLNVERRAFTQNNDNERDWSPSASRGDVDSYLSPYRAGCPSTTTPGGTQPTGGGKKRKHQSDWDDGPGHHKRRRPKPPAATPVPATILLFGSGLAGLAGIRRRAKINS